MYRRCMKSSEKVRFVRNTFQGALFLHLYLTDLLQMRGRRMSCTSKYEFRSKYVEIFLNCGVRKQEMVAANSYLRQRLLTEGEKCGFKVIYPSPILCTDNGMMIAMRAYYSATEGCDYADMTLNARPNL